MHRYAVASRRARLLADVLRTRAIDLNDRSTVLLITEYLEMIAARLHCYPAPATPEPNGIPRNLAPDIDALARHQASIPVGLSVRIFEYVTAPLTGMPVELAPLNPASDYLATQERRLLDAIAVMAVRVDDESDAVAHSALAGLLSLHNRHDRLAHLAAVTPAERSVHVRTGTYRRAYHPHAACPALTGKRRTYSGQESMPERMARAEGLTLCRRCPA
ncbi:hypothetical protein [Streptomyces collinus]